MNSGTGFIHICRSNVRSVRLIMFVIRSIASFGLSRWIPRGKVCRLSMKTRTPYTNVLPNGERQVYLNPYSEPFPKMLTYNMNIDGSCCKAHQHSTDAKKRPNVDDSIKSRGECFSRRSRIIATRYDKLAVRFLALYIWYIFWSG